MPRPPCQSVPRSSRESAPNLSCETGPSLSPARIVRLATHAALLLLAALLLAACGGNGDADASGSGAGDATSSETRGSAPSGTASGSGSGVTESGSGSGESRASGSVGGSSRSGGSGASGSPSPGGAGQTSAPGTLPGGSAPTLSEALQDWELLGTREHVYNEGPRTFEELRLVRSDGEATYALFVPPPEGPGAVVLVTQPYDGIVWSGEEVDTRWAAQAGGETIVAPDVDGPGFDAETSAPIAYTETPFAMLAEGANAWLLNEVGVLMVFGRFYAGDTLDGYVRDTVAGLAWLAQDARVDGERIGVYGGSWGGFMSIYGAAWAPEGMAPPVVGFYPPVGMAEFAEAVEEVVVPGLLAAGRVADAAFFEPYLRRMRPALEAPAPFVWTRDVLCGRLQNDVFVVHDELDTLVAFAPVFAWAEGCGRVQGAWYRREEAVDWATTPLGHGPLLADPVFPMAYTMGVAWMVDRLRPDDGRQRLFLYTRPALDELLANARAAEQRGLAVGWLANALTPLVREGVMLIEFSNPQSPGFGAGAEVLADALGAAWGEEIAAAEVAGWLAGLD